MLFGYFVRKIGKNVFYGCVCFGCFDGYENWMFVLFFVFCGDGSGICDVGVIYCDIFEFDGRDLFIVWFDDVFGMILDCYEVICINWCNIFGFELVIGF